MKQNSFIGKIVSLNGFDEHIAIVIYQLVLFE